MSQNDNQKSRDEIFVDWLQAWGQPTQNKSGVPYMKVENSIQTEALESLIQTLLKEGYTPAQIKSDGVKVKILESLTSDYSKNPKKWKEIVLKKWKFALDRAFGQPDQVAKAKEYAEIERASTPLPKEIQPTESPSDKEVTDADRIKMPSYVIDEIDFLAGIESDNEPE